jgi:hypothetical protein
LTVNGFSARGDLIVDHGWVVAREFGHLTQGVVVTAWACQGVTVDHVLVGMGSESFPATNERSAYVALTRGKESVNIFTDDKLALLSAASRPDDPMSATELSQSKLQEDGRAVPPGLGRRMRGSATQHNSVQQDITRNASERELDHDR